MGNETQKTDGWKTRTRALLSHQTLAVEALERFIYTVFQTSKTFKHNTTLCLYANRIGGGG